MLEAVSDPMKAYLRKVAQPVEIVTYLDDSLAAQHMLKILQEVAALSENISLVDRSGADVQGPSFGVTRPEYAPNIRFAFVPMGRGFVSLILALLQVGGQPLKLGSNVISQVQKLEGDYFFETFISLTCPNCQEAVQALNAMTIINPRIRTLALDSSLFPQEMQARQVTAIPTVFLNGEMLFSGRAGAEEILAKLQARTFTSAP